MTERTIDTAVGQLAVRTWGEGPPALLWHSLFVDSRSWDGMVAALPPTRRFVLVDGPGHGASTDSGHRYSLEDCAAAALAVLDDLGIDEPVDWVGNAWGGHVGFLFAARWPHRCRSVAALGTPVAELTTKERLRMHLLLALYRIAGPNRAVVGGTTDVLLSAHTRRTDDAAVRLVHECLRRADRRRLRNAVVSISLHRTALDDVLGEVRCPALVATGSEHHGFTADQARAAVRLLPQGSLAIVPDAAYLLPLEAPAACADLVERLWSGDPTRTPLG